MRDALRYSAAVSLSDPPPAIDPAEPPPLDEVLDAMAEPVLVVSDGVVTTANAAARGLLGQHIVGEDVRVAIRHPVAAERLIAAGEDPAEPIPVIGIGGADQRWDMRITRTSDGTRVVQLLDRTQSHAAERMRVDFVANASHELRTPLASILGYVETLRDLGGDEPALRERFLGIVADEAQRMQRVVEDLISLSRVEGEKYRLPDVAVDLRRLLVETCRELRDRHDGRGADLLVEPLPAGTALVAGDRAQLSQALHNLVGNAMKYGRAGTPVTLSLALHATGFWRLGVRDRGDGIAPEHLPRLTERFYRVDAGRSRALGGTGLGLAIVKHIVERHRGRLEIESLVGDGTTITLVLPPFVSQKGNAATAQSA